MRAGLILPSFPWDSLSPFALRARAHPDGIVDLSVGSPVDSTPAVVREALAAASDAHAYPQTAGSEQLCAAIAGWFDRRRGVSGLTPHEVMPTIGSKELIAGLALWLGLGPADVVVQPRLAYPTYAVGAALAGCTVHTGDDPARWPASTGLIWLNSPGNPDGRVLGIDELRGAVERARELGAVIVSDECYAELAWEAESTMSILDDRITDGDRRGVLAVYSLSKQSNLAGYRAGLIAGGAEVVGEILAVRRNLGLIPPAPVQAAMVAALSDDRHVAVQKEVYRRRRARLAPALGAAGFRIDSSEAGLYLWASRGEDAWKTVSALAEVGILVVPGTFYGEDNSRHVRVALTATDERIEAAVARLETLSNKTGDVLADVTVDPQAN
ncbi:MAG: succinyldiaminopimelate transaminase [Terrimesophilobacter sp.]